MTYHSIKISSYSRTFPCCKHLSQGIWAAPPQLIHLKTLSKPVIPCRSATRPELLRSELTFLVHDRHKSSMLRQHFVGHFGDRKRHQHGRSLFSDVSRVLSVNMQRSARKSVRRSPCLIRFLSGYFSRPHHRCSSSNPCDQLLRNSHRVYDKLLHTYHIRLFLRFLEILFVFELGLVGKVVAVLLVQAKYMVFLRRHRNLVSPNL